MARIKFKADGTSESAGAGGGGFAKKVRGIYTLQICEVSDGEKTSAQAKNPGVDMTKFRMEIADDDERGQLGAHVYHNVAWIPRGDEEKARGGHGIAVHFLHAVKMDYDGEFDFDEQDFLQPSYAMLRALLEVEDYQKQGAGGRTFTNEKYVIRELYTDAHPEPDELPAPREPRKAAVPADARQTLKDRQAEKHGVAGEEPVPF